MDATRTRTPRTSEGSLEAHDASARGFTTSASAAPVESGWRRFWNRGGWWKAVLLAVTYMGLYLGASQLMGMLFGSQINDKNPLADAPTVFYGTALAIIVGALALLSFAASLKWLPEMFGKQPITGRWWMWIAPLIVVGAAALRIAGTDFAHYNTGAVVAVFATGLAIGLAEELLTRGFAVNLLRKGGYSERNVMILSSLLFALLHSANILSGQSLATVGVTVLFTFVFGIAMYLTMRVTGSIVWAIVLHAITDPTTMLATGGIDTTTVHVNPLAMLAGASMYAYIIIAIIAVFAVRGRVGRSQERALLA